MPGKEQLNNTSKEADSILPQKDNEVFTPRFSFTKNMVKHLHEDGINKTGYGTFMKQLDDYLEYSATTENLIAIGFVAIPSNEGQADMIVKEGGFVLNAITYWSLPNEAFQWTNKEKYNPTVPKNHDKWFDVGDIFDRSFLNAFDIVSISNEDYPTLESVRAELENPAIRREKYTLTVDIDTGSCEFWGLVTTEQLRQELAKAN